MIDMVRLIAVVVGAVLLVAVLVAGLVLQHAIPSALDRARAESRAEVTAKEAASVKCRRAVSEDRRDCDNDCRVNYARERLGDCFSRCAAFQVFRLSVCDRQDARTREEEAAQQYIERSPMLGAPPLLPRAGRAAPLLDRP